MRFVLTKLRMVPCPTLLGWACLLVLSVLPLLVWWFGAEPFLAVTSPVQAEVLVLEAWTKEDGARAAAAEFSRPGAPYRYIVAAGGLTGERWNGERWSYAEIAARELRRAGIPANVIIRAEAPDVDSQRTFASAVAARNALGARGIRATSINVLTRSSHARRSRLTFSHVFDQVEVGVIAWKPPGFASSAWWKSTERTTELIKEMAGYLFERVLRSGRFLKTRSEQIQRT